MSRIYVRRNADSLYPLFKASLSGHEVLWDRRTGETVYRRCNERRSLPPDSWDDLGFVVETPTVPCSQRDLPHNLVEPSSAAQSGAFVRLADKLVAQILDRLTTPASRSRTVT